ncbi:MAG: lysophospholipid acyltransferase family protein [Hyphomonadaceae bacterium]|nr:lysophospholipid acyltransferase family protein [Hyphomonadaceae bacterium]MBC6412655.1 lysophospholipid acyltransferase family protein [Hyphomonadaceae bacterium]
MADGGFARHLVWRFEALAYDIVCILLKPFSFDAISTFGGWAFEFLGPLTPKHHIARTGLKLAFPDANEKQTGTWLTTQWNNTGRTFFEFPVLHRLRAFEPEGRIRVLGIDKLQAVIDSNRPVVIVTGHFANWEVIAVVLTQSGLPVQITYRKINNPYIDARVRTQREAYGTKFFVPKSGRKGARQLLNALDKGNSIALLNDQKFNEGLSVPFFGVNAMTAPGPARLALKSGAPLLPLSVTRDKALFTVTVHDPIQLEDTGNKTQDVENGVRLITNFMEDRIRENPDQWFWIHRRWPKNHYR